MIGRNLGIFLPKLVGHPGPALVLLAVWGMIRGRGTWLWLLAPLLPVPFIINPMDERFWIPYLPVFVLAAGLGGIAPGGPALVQGAVEAGSLTGGCPGRDWWLAAWDDTYWIKRNREAFYGLKDAGAWLTESRPTAETVIAAYKPYTSFWAGCRFIKYPEDMEAADLVCWARNNGAGVHGGQRQGGPPLAKGLDPLLEQPPAARPGRKMTLVKLLEYDLVRAHHGHLPDQRSAARPLTQPISSW